METYEKEVTTEENGETIVTYVECKKEEATHLKTTYPESKFTYNQERPGKREKL